jgi:histidinol phosphatase-like PHP family hydrolase
MGQPRLRGNVQYGEKVLKIVDLHTHSFLSDGALVPAELVRRAKLKGYEAIAITDHVDSGNLALVLAQIMKSAKDLNRSKNIKVLAGVELTHIPPDLFPELSEKARDCGAEIVVAHGESVAEPVEPGTNLAALESDIDILAHPGLLTPKEVKLAKKRGICLEISARKGHSLANGHLVKLARKFEAKVVLNTDSHTGSDLFTLELVRKVGLGAGLTEKELRAAFNNSKELVKKRFKM